MFRDAGPIGAFGSRGLLARNFRGPAANESSANPVNRRLSAAQTARDPLATPAPFSRGQTAVVPQSEVEVDEEKGKQFITLRDGASLSTLVSGLNALGVTPRDMISILQTIKAAGALQADIEVM